MFSSSSFMELMLSFIIHASIRGHKAIMGYFDHTLTFPELPIKIDHESESGTSY